MHEYSALGDFSWFRWRLPVCTLIKTTENFNLHSANCGKIGNLRTITNYRSCVWIVDSLGTISIFVHANVGFSANFDFSEGEHWYSEGRIYSFSSDFQFLEVRNSIDVHGIDCSKQHREMKREFSGTVEYKMRTSKCYIGKQFLVSLFWKIELYEEFHFASLHLYCLVETKMHINGLSII